MSIWAEDDPRRRYQGDVIGVGGPPHSGKTVFVNALYRRLLELTPADTVFLERAVPDGEGMFSTEADPGLVQRIRAKHPVTGDYERRVISAIERIAPNRRFPLLLLDLGGRIGPYNDAILSRCTGLIIVSRESGAIAARRGRAPAGHEQGEHAACRGGSLPGQVGHRMRTWRRGGAGSRGAGRRPSVGQAGRLAPALPA